MRFVPALLAALLFSSAASAATAPRIGISSLSELDVPDAPFAADANAEADVDAAFARARRDGKPQSGEHQNGTSEKGTKIWKGTHLFVPGNGGSGNRRQFRQQSVR